MKIIISVLCATGTPSLLRLLWNLHRWRLFRRVVSENLVVIVAS